MSNIPRIYSSQAAQIRGMPTGGGGGGQAVSGDAAASIQRAASAVPAKAEKQHLGYQWRHFIAGGMGGMVGAMMTCPLEVVKTVLQSKEQKNKSLVRVVGGILRYEGLPGFFKGIGPMVLGVVPARATYFATYDGTKAFCRKQGMQDGSGVYTLSAIAAGVTTATMINPVWVVKTRVQLQKQSAYGGSENGVVYKNSLDAAVRIWKEEGPRAFFKGLVPSYWGISESALQFVIYEHLKKSMRASSAAGQSGDRGEIKSVEFIGAAGLSKLIAAVATYPHEVVRTRMREREAIYKSAIDCVRRVWMEEGVKGMYGGMIPHLMRVVPNTAIIFFTYEHVSKWLEEYF